MEQKKKGQPLSQDGWPFSLIPQKLLPPCKEAGWTALRVLWQNQKLVSGLTSRG